MNILSIDTSAKSSSACLSKANDGKIKIISKKIINHVATQSQTILPAIDECLKKSVDKSADKSADKNYDALSLCVGPGSFTGLRVGAATIKGLAFARNLKIVPISSLEALALNITSKLDKFNTKNTSAKFFVNKNTATIIIPLIDARAGRVYFSVFDTKLNRYIEDDHIEIKTLLNIIRVKFQNLKYKTNLIFVGDGASTYKKLINDTLKSVKNLKLTFANDKENSDIITSIAYLSHKYFDKKAVYSSDLKLNYLQASQAERNLKLK